MKRLIQVLGFLSIFFLLHSAGQAYELSGGSKKDADELIQILNLYYNASQQKDPKAYGELFLFASRENMTERIGTAIQLWQMYDLQDYEVQVQEVSISPTGTTALSRYQAKTTLTNNRGENRTSANEFMALFFKQNGRWLLGDINFADQFQATMDRLHMVDTYTSYPEQIVDESEVPKGAGKTKKAPTAKAAKAEEKEVKQGDVSGMKRYEDKKHKVNFYYPEEMALAQEGEKTKFTSNSGSSYITYEPMAYGKNGGKYKNSEEMIKYLSEQMQKHFDAKINNISAVQVGNVSGNRLRFFWFMDGQQLEQVETVLDGPDRMYSFGMIGSPDEFNSYAAGYESMVESFHLTEKEEEKKVEKQENKIFIAFPDRGAVTGTLVKESVTITFKTEKDAKHVIQCTTMEQAPVILFLYDEQGKEVDSNYRDGQIYSGFKEELPKGKNYFLMLAPFKDMNIGKPFTVQVSTETKPQAQPVQIATPTDAKSKMVGNWKEVDPMMGRGESPATYRFDANGSIHFIEYIGSTKVFKEVGTWKFDKDVLVIFKFGQSERYIAESETVYRAVKPFGPPERGWYVKFEKYFK